MLDRSSAPAALLLTLVFGALTFGIVLSSDAVAESCDRFDPSSGTWPRLAPFYVPDGFVLGSVYRHRGIELWFRDAASVRPTDESAWFSVYGSASDAGIWQDRFGQDVEPGPDARRALLYDDPVVAGRSVLLWREGRSWAAVEYQGLKVTEARAIATSVQPLSSPDWERLRRSGASFDVLVACETIDGVLWRRSATVAGPEVAGDEPVRSEEWLRTGGSEQDLQILLPSRGEDPRSGDVPEVLPFSIDFEQVDDEIRLLVATVVPIQRATARVGDGLRHRDVEPSRITPLPDALCGPDWNCTELIISVPTEVVQMEASTDDRGVLTVEIVTASSA